MNIEENALHVVILHDGLLQGVTVEGGNASASPDDLARSTGAGVHCFTHGSATIRNCVFCRCSAMRAGGGVYGYGALADLVIEDCTFQGNRALVTMGGGVCCTHVTINDCVFQENTAETGGGAAYCESTFFAQCVFQHTLHVGTGGGARRALVNSDNFDADPQFVSPTARTAIRIRGKTATIASPPARPALRPVGTTPPGLPPDDLDGNDRVRQCRIDLGAHESPYAAAVFDDCNGNGIDDDCDVYVATSSDCNLNQVSDECDLLSGLSNDTDANGTPDECDCPGDFDGDRACTLADLQRLLSATELPYCTTPTATWISTATWIWPTYRRHLQCMGRCAIETGRKRVGVGAQGHRGRDGEAE